MRTITKTIYEFDELSEESKEKACKYVKENWNNFYPWHNENQESLSGFAKLLGGRSDFSISLDGRGNYAKIKDLPGYLTTEEQYLSEDSYQPTDWIHDNSDTILKSCPFTGFHMDESLLDPMREWLQKPDDRTLEDLIQEGCDLWVKHYLQDWEDCYTDEYIGDFLMANNFEFTQEGRVYK